MRLLLFLFTHGAALAIGFGLGVYLLPILTAPDGPDRAMLEQKAQEAAFSATFSRGRAGSDFLHWGEGTVSLSASEIVHMGRLSPGPDYRLYLTNTFVEDEAGFEAVKAQAVRVGDVKTFDGFILTVPDAIDTSAYSTVVIWCEAFSEFITSAQYQ